MILVRHKPGPHLSPTQPSIPTDSLQKSAQALRTSRAGRAGARASRDLVSVGCILQGSFSWLRDRGVGVEQDLGLRVRRRFGGSVSCVQGSGMRGLDSPKIGQPITGSNS